MLNSQQTSAKSITRHIYKGLTILLWGLIAAYALFITHHFFGYINHTPYIAFDDAVANISYTIATLGRIGFLLSPHNIGEVPVQHLNFFMHGPWYYLFGGLLIWIFGFSFALLRSIHLMSIIGAVFLSFYFFRSVRFRATAAAFSIAMLTTFQNTHWPMVRADSFGAPLFALYFVLAGLAMQSRKPILWFFSGIVATMATTNHLMGWAMAPASVVIFGVAAWNQRRETDQLNGAPSILRQFGGQLSGWATGSLLFLWGIGFNLVALFKAGKLHPGGDLQGDFISLFFHVLKQHIDLAFYGIPGNALWLYAALVLSAALLFGSVWMTQTTRHSVLSLVAPPAIVMFLHLCSRGLYNNFHMGYSILIQVLAFWSLAASVTAIFITTKKSFPILNRMGEAGVFLASCGVMSLTLYNMVHAGDPRNAYLNKWISFPNYYEEVLGPIPTGARAWGTSQFGVETPRRIQLVQMFEGMRLTSALQIPEKRPLAPDYVIWGFTLSSAHLINAIRSERRTNMVNLEHSLDVRYALVSMVNAPPYGVTRVYQRIVDSDSASSRMPIISTFNPERGQWSRSLGAPLSPSCTPVTPARFELPERFKKPKGMLVRHALRTFSCPLQTGEYLVRVNFSGKSASRDAHGRMLTASSTKDQSQLMPTDLGPDFDTAPYFLNDRAAFLYLRHHEGNAFVSQFDDTDGDDIESIEFYPINSFMDFTEFRKKQAFSPLPPFTEWRVDSPGGKLALPDQGGWTDFQGDPSPFGYQLTSPTLNIPEPSQPTQVCARLEFQPITGHVALGVLDKAGNWLLPASTPLSQGLNEICWPFERTRSNQVTMVLANINRNGPLEGKSHFQIRNAQIMNAPLHEPIYTDFLVNKSVEAGLLEKAK